MSDLTTELKADVRAAKRTGNVRLANRLQSILDSDNPASTLKAAAESNHRPDELRPFLEYVGSETSAEDASDSPTTYTEAEYAEAAKRTDRMTREEYRDWESAPSDGRVSG